MKTNIPERIAALREAMRQQKVDAYITVSYTHLTLPTNSRV